MNELTEYYNKKKIVSLAYDSEGCPVPIGEEKCGETKGFDIIMDFQKLYQDKISQIDVTAGGDRLQEKVDIQQDWINDLTEQNRLMARVIEELEIEAIDKVQSLEEKLQTCSKSLSEDEKRLLEKDEMIKELQESLTTKQLNSAADISKKAEEYKNLQEKMEETRNAFSKEMSNKHDVINELRSKITGVQKNYNEISKESSFKDEIIKELRKEIKKIKHQQRRQLSRENETLLDKSIQTMDTDVLDLREKKDFMRILKIHHLKEAEESNNSTVIYLNRDIRSSTKNYSNNSSDSSECSAINVKHINTVFVSKSENDIEPLKRSSLNNPKERSILTNRHSPRSHQEDFFGEHYSLNKRSIPKHIPVKTYVNNIEGNK